MRLCLHSYCDLRRTDMTIAEAVKVRHTIRAYSGKAIEGERLKKLQEMIRHANEEGGLHFQLINGQENALSPFRIRYGKWTGVTNYIAIVGPDTPNLEQKCGYYGEQIVLWAETAGLKTGWVETTCEQVPDSFSVEEGERFVMSLCIGESDKAGGPHKLKAVSQLSDVAGAMPEWFEKGMELAQLAPTAGNQQLFCIHYDGEKLFMTTEKGLLEA